MVCNRITAFNRLALIAARVVTRVPVAPAGAWMGGARTVTVLVDQMVVFLVVQALLAADAACLAVVIAAFVAVAAYITAAGYWADLVDMTAPVRVLVPWKHQPAAAVG